MTTDIHTHLGADRASIPKVNEYDYARHTDTLIQRMDIFGIDRAVLTPVEPFASTDLYLQAAAISPERLYAACEVMPRPIDVARRKVKKYVDEGCVALVLDDIMYHPSDPAVDALVESAVDKELPVFFHSHDLTGDTIGFIDRVTTLWPDGKFVVLHMGGLFGFPNLLPLIGRRNLWLDLSITLVKLVESPLRVYLDALLQDVGVRHLVFGSEHHTEYPHLMDSLNMIDLNVETSRVVTNENAWLILGVPFS